METTKRSGIGTRDGLPSAWAARPSAYGLRCSSLEARDEPSLRVIRRERPNPANQQIDIGFSMDFRFERETFLTLDENGEVVPVAKTTFKTQKLLDGSVEEYETLLVFSIPGLGEVITVEDAVYQYQVLKTGMKLRRQT